MLVQRKSWEMKDFSKSRRKSGRIFIVSIQGSGFPCPQSHIQLSVTKLNFTLSYTIMFCAVIVKRDSLFYKAKNLNGRK